MKRELEEWVPKPILPANFYPVKDENKEKMMEELRIIKETWYKIKINEIYSPGVVVASSHYDTFLVHSVLC